MPPSQLATSAPERSARYLTRAEREELAILRALGHGVREIARRLQRAPATISRELRRNAATRSGGFDYRATTAQWHADRASRRPKVARLAVHDALRTYVTERLSGTVVAPERALDSWPDRAVEIPPSRPASAPTLGARVESRADCASAAAGLPG